MAPPATPTHPRRMDPVVDRYITEFQKRHRQFVRDRKLELRQIGLDAFTRMYHEYFALPTKPAYEVLLQVILEPDERDRLHLDQPLTQAWQIFVDLCWLRARATRIWIVFCAVVLSLSLAALIIFASPRLGGVVVLTVVGLFIGLWALPSVMGRRR